MSGVLSGPTVPRIGPGILTDLGQRGTLVRGIKPGPAQPADPFIPSALFRVVEDHYAMVQPGTFGDQFDQHNVIFPYGVHSLRGICLARRLSASVS